MSIIWLASYPKSGNTWMRVFLTNYLRNGDEPSDINDLEKIGIASAHGLFGRYAGIDTSELTADEIDTCRPDIYQLLAQDCDDTRFVKVHDAYTLLTDGRPLFPSESTQAAIYIVRNPLDVAVSMMYHMGDSDIDKTIARMANDQAKLTASVKQGNSQCRQKLLTWSGHVRSWLDTQKTFPVHLVRYEDMQCDPRNTFQQVITFSGLPLDDKRLEKAIEFSQFQTLHQQELANGFRERPSSKSLFFRHGQIGSWEKQLRPNQAQRIIADHSATMYRLGYLTSDGTVAF